MRDKMLVFGQPLITEDEIAEVTDSLRKCWLGTGPKVQAFEKDFARYKGTPHAAAVNSCTAALHLACLALDLQPGDEVITSAMTFCATVNAIIHSGATPVLADIDPATRNIDPARIEEKITPRTKAILVIHFAGLPCDMNMIMRIARDRGLFVIEDCAHAIETEYEGQKVGTFGDFGCFSFYATKNITTGEGGMVISPHEERINRIKIMALHGMSQDAWKRFSDEGYRHYFVMDRGFKYNMMDLQAAIGLHQLKKITTYWERRRVIWDRYLEAFKNLPLNLPEKPNGDIRHAYHLFTVLINEQKAGLTRDRFLEEMTRRMIGVGVHYLSIPEHPFYQRTYGWDPAAYPHARAYGQQTISLPLSPKLSDDDVQDVVTAVQEILG
ncbi:MAG: DegT/DnrJ/EryC1/StrS aminotransferase family protein [Candidatus Omnitrophica bacterium]|nr:DegT/DnrJ/EryC1/StrS aminotransferase family protein [Candidatus Omnitrophota bacterium]